VSAIQKERKKLQLQATEEDLDEDLSLHPKRREVKRIEKAHA